jgi:AraC-like DNA-binding protein
MATSKIFGSKFIALETKTTDLSKEAGELIEIIENRRLYANKELSLELLACQLEMSKQLITTIFNSHLGISFADFINNLRVKEAKIKLLDPHYDLFTIEAIGFEVGFGSRSTFYELFKKHTGYTPSEFKLQRNVISG